MSGDLLSNPNESQASKEEADLLARSNKKVKLVNGVGSATDLDSMVEETMEEVEGRKLSYKEMMMGDEENTRDLPHAHVLEAISDDDDDDGDESDLECPTIKVTMDDKKRIRRRWSKTLIVKLVGRSIGYNFLLRRLHSLWQIKSGLELMDVGNDVYLAKFTSIEDYERALFGGPWVIADHYLQIQQWYPNFDPTELNINRLAVWVRFPNLPVEYFDEQILLRIGGKVGKPLRVDDTTLAATRGKYARVCVEVDLDKPLLSKFRLHRRVRRIEYEALHLICFNCGKYGHGKDNCPLNTEGPHDGEGIEAPIEQQPKMFEPAPEITEQYGQWMLVARNSRRKGRNNGQSLNLGLTKHSNGNQGRQGSRFVALDIEDDNDLINGEDFTGIALGNSDSKVTTEKAPLHNNRNINKAIRGGKGKYSLPREEVFPGEDQFMQNAIHNQRPILRGESSRRGGRGTYRVSGPRIAAALDHHVLVQGDNNAKTISRVTIFQDNNTNGPVHDNRQDLNHHQDPTKPHPSVPDEEMVRGFTHSSGEEDGLDTDVLEDNDGMEGVEEDNGDREL